MRPIIPREPERALPSVQVCPDSGQTALGMKQQSSLGDDSRLVCSQGRLECARQVSPWSEYTP